MPEPAPVALVGDLLATQAKGRGVAAILVDGAVRDVDELRELGLPIWARYVRVRAERRSASRARSARRSRSPARRSVRVTSSSWTRTEPSSSSASASRTCWRRPAIGRSASASSARSSRRARCRTTSTTSGAWSKSDRADPRPRTDRARGAPHAEAGGEPPLLRRRTRHGGGSARRAVRLPAGVGRLPPLQPEADGVAQAPGSGTSRCGRGAPRRSTAGSRPSRRRDAGSAGSTETWATARRTASRTPTGTSSSSTTRRSATRRRSTCGRRGGISRSATSAGARRSNGSTTSTCWRRTCARTARSPGTCSATACTSGSSSTTGPRRAPGSASRSPRTSSSTSRTRTARRDGCTTSRSGSTRARSAFAPPTSSSTHDVDHRGGALEARGRAGLLPVRVRARRQPDRGHDRWVLRVRPGLRADHVDRGGARARPVLGREDDRELPHVRHARRRRRGLTERGSLRDALATAGTASSSPQSSSRAAGRSPRTEARAQGAGRSRGISPRTRGSTCSRSRTTPADTRCSRPTRSGPT